MRLLTVLILVLLTSAPTYAKGPAYHKVKAKNGDGVYAILRRYQLLDKTENIQRFYELNGLKHNSHLTIGKEYVLPILVYEYDSKSIRSSIGVDNWDMAVRISEWNDRLVENGLRSQTYEADRQLWVPMHEMVTSGATVTEERPATPDVKLVSAATVEAVAEPAAHPEDASYFDVPLFGSEHSRVTRKSDDLKGKVFYLVSGHGGPDPGAISEFNGEQLCEDEYAYDVTLRLAKRLMEHGAIVEVVVQDPNDGIRSESILDCDQEELSLGKTPIPLWQKARLQQRTHEINTLHKKYQKQGLHDQKVVCIHVDSRSPQRRQDVFFYYYDESKSGRDLAFQLQKVFKEKYTKNRPQRSYRGTVSARSLYVLKHTDPTAVYVELANIRNASDRKRILPESNRQALANWLFDGLTR